MSDYGEGKTRQQEAYDSMAVIAWGLLFIGAGLAIVGCLLAWWLL